MPIIVLSQVERVWLLNLRPGPESFERFTDPTAVMTAVLSKPEPCLRCGECYAHENINSTSSCVAHTCDDGSAGVYVLHSSSDSSDDTHTAATATAASTTENSYDSSTSSGSGGQWSCCAATDPSKCAFYFLFYCCNYQEHYQ
jgi:hypothetical protein